MLSPFGSITSYSVFNSTQFDLSSIRRRTQSSIVSFKFTFKTSISFPRLLSLTFKTSSAVSWSGASSQDLFLSHSLPNIPMLYGCLLRCNRSRMTLSFSFCASDLCLIISQHAFTKICLLPMVRIINYIACMMHACMKPFNSSDGRMVRASALETRQLDLGLIPSRVKLMSYKIHIHSFSA